MKTLSKIIAAVFLSVFVAGCAQDRSIYNPLTDFEEVHIATIFAMPEAQPSLNYSTDLLQRGRYLTGLFGCSSCHTDGALIGRVNSRRILAGSSTGIAYSSPFEDGLPGIVFPPNLTPDMETGLGTWTMDQIAQMVKVGTRDHSSGGSSVMPWSTFVNITDDDALAIAAYLKSLPPVRHEIPRNIPAGEPTSASYIFFGVYRGEITK